jgi:ribonuclease HII
MITGDDIYLNDESLRREGFDPLAGVDEAGRGPIAGPVVAAAVVLKGNVRIEGLKDSKRLTAGQRESLFWEILAIAEDIGVGVVDADEIDRLNIYRATKKAMMMAVDDLGNRPALLVIDAMELSLPIEQVSMVRAESKSASVAAASIIAKVTRDRLMEHFHSLFPVYGFGVHKGYATRDHLKMLETYGPCSIHRNSFSPVSSLRLPF